MGTKVRSARGEMVDFDLLKVKQQIVIQSPLSEPVKERQEDVDRKMRRHLRRKKPADGVVAADDTEEDLPESNQ